MIRSTAPIIFTAFVCVLGCTAHKAEPAGAGAGAARAPALDFTPPVVVTDYFSLDCGMVELLFRDAMGRNFSLYNEPFKSDLMLSARHGNPPAVPAVPVKITKGHSLQKRLAAALRGYISSRRDDEAMAKLIILENISGLEGEDLVLLGTHGFVLGLEHIGSAEASGIMRSRAKWDALKDKATTFAFKGKSRSHYCTGVWFDATESLRYESGVLKALRYHMGFRMGKPWAKKLPKTITDIVEVDLATQKWRRIPLPPPKKVEDAKRVATLAEAIAVATKNHEIPHSYVKHQMPSAAAEEHAHKWEYGVVIRYPGTRSEGSHGILFKDGALLEGKVNSRPIVTPFGLMRFFGNKFTVTWQQTGWHPVRIRADQINDAVRAKKVIAIASVTGMRVISSGTKSEGLSVDLNVHGTLFGEVGRRKINCSDYTNKLPRGIAKGWTYLCILDPTETEGQTVYRLLEAEPLTSWNRSRREAEITNRIKYLQQEGQ